MSNSPLNPTDVIVDYRVLVRGGQEFELISVNEVPKDRELVVVENRRRLKLGDGVTPFRDLPYIDFGNAPMHSFSQPPTIADGEPGDWGIHLNGGDPYLYGPKFESGWSAGIRLRGEPGAVSTVPGPRGLSSYEVAVAEGYGGSAAQWLASLKVKGDKGDDGLAGIAARRRVLEINETNSGSVVCEWNGYDEIRVRLTTDTTFIFQGALDGQGCLLKLRQDGDGNHLVTLPPEVRYNALLRAYNVTATPNAIDRIGFIYDGQDTRYDFASVIPAMGP